MRLSNLILITALATVSQATTLKELIDNTLKNNELVVGVGVAVISGIILKKVIK